MSEAYQDQTGSRESNDETNRQLKRIAAGLPPKDPEPDWQLSDATKELGQKNITEIRQSTSQSETNQKGISDMRAILEAKRKQSLGEALSPDEIKILAKIQQ